MLWRALGVSVVLPFLPGFSLLRITLSSSVRNVCLSWLNVPSVCHNSARHVYLPRLPMCCRRHTVEYVLVLVLIADADADADADARAANADGCPRASVIVTMSSRLSL